MRSQFTVEPQNPEKNWGTSLVTSCHNGGEQKGKLLQAWTQFSLAKHPLIQIQKVAAQLQRAERDESIGETGRNTKKRVLVLVASHSYDLLLNK